MRIIIHPVVDKRDGRNYQIDLSQMLLQNTFAFYTGQIGKLHVVGPLAEITREIRDLAGARVQVTRSRLIVFTDNPDDPDYAKLDAVVLHVLGKHLQRPLSVQRPTAKTAPTSRTTGR